MIRDMKLAGEGIKLGKSALGVVLLLLFAGMLRFVSSARLLVSFEVLEM
jgi:hypothetical protein